MKNSNKILLGIILFLIAAGLFAILTLKSGINQSRSEAIKGNNQIIKELRTVPSFDAIKSQGQFGIVLTQGDEKVEIEAEDNLLPYLISEVIDGELVLKQDKNERLGFTVKPIVYVSMPELSSIDLSGVSDLTMKDSFYMENASIGISGSSNSTFFFGCEKLIMNVSGFGQLHMKGSGEKADISISGTVAMDGADFSCHDANIRVNGASEASIFVKNNLEAAVSGTSSVYYYGNPVSKSTRISGVGEIVPK